MILPLLRRLARDRRGNVAMIFALAIIPIVSVIGLAVDYSNAIRVRLKLQDATDSAVLAMARDGLKLTDSQIAARAKARFPIGSPGWVKADDIINSTAKTAGSRGR